MQARTSVLDRNDSHDVVRLLKPCPKFVVERPRSGSYIAAVAHVRGVCAVRLSSHSLTGRVRKRTTRRTREHYGRPDGPTGTQRAGGRDDSRRREDPRNVGRHGVWLRSCSAERDAVLRNPGHDSEIPCCWIWLFSISAGLRPAWRRMSSLRCGPRRRNACPEQPLWRSLGWNHDHCGKNHRLGRSAGPGSRRFEDRFSWRRSTSIRRLRSLYSSR